jgi:hypothetical protein
MPTVGRYLSRSGVPKGDCGIVFERGCETSYDLALGFARDCAQRCQVAETECIGHPEFVARPHREGPVCAWATETSAPAAANAYTNREVNIFRLPAFVAHAAHTVIKFKRHDGATRRGDKDLPDFRTPPAGSPRPISGLEGFAREARDMQVHHDTSHHSALLPQGDLATRSRSREMR